MRKWQTLLSIAYLVSGCTRVDEQSIVNGVWESVGYGTILEIRDGEYSIYDVTKISCLPVRRSSVTDLTECIRVKNDTLFLQQGIVTYRYVRLNKLPILCNVNAARTERRDPPFVFEVFANTVEEHFAYMELNNVNWDSLYSLQKEKVDSTSSDVELYQVMNETLRLINDNHGQIEASETVYEQMDLLQPTIELREEVHEYGDFEIANITTQAFLVEEFTNDSKIIRWGKVNNKLGYIQIKAMWLFADLNLNDSLVRKDGWVTAFADEMTKRFEADYIDLEVKGVRRIMDRVMADLSSMEGIIIDVRFNGGGQDAVSLEVLRRFNSQVTTIATHKAKSVDGFTSGQPIYLPSSDSAFTKPIFILTSKQSASAADLFAMATLRLPHATRIGSRTNGAISTALRKKLPNDWYFSISNEVYLDNRGICYENVGVPVHYELNYPSERQTFFHWIAENANADKQKILRVIDERMK